MDIDITRFFKEASPRDYFASVAELGSNAGAITWGHAMEDVEGEAGYCMLHNEACLEAMRERMLAYGAWDQEEIAAWSDAELNALFLQEVSSAIREAPEFDTRKPDWAAYDRMAKEGIVSGSLFAHRNKIYFCLGD